MLLYTTKFVVICHISNRKLINTPNPNDLQHNCQDGTANSTTFNEEQLLLCALAEAAEGTALLPELLVSRHWEGSTFKIQHLSFLALTSQREKS